MEKKPYAIRKVSHFLNQMLIFIYIYYTTMISVLNLHFANFSAIFILGCFSDS
jgi:hypothetical protein